MDANAAVGDDDRLVVDRVGDRARKSEVGDRDVVRLLAGALLGEASLLDGAQRFDPGRVATLLRDPQTLAKDAARIADEGDLDVAVSSQLAAVEIDRYQGSSRAMVDSLP